MLLYNIIKYREVPEILTSYLKDGNLKMYNDRKSDQNDILFTAAHQIIKLCIWTH